MSASAATPAVTIDRLVLDMPGLDAASGERLATLVATHLARAGLAGSDIAIPRLTLQLDAPDVDLDRLARRIAAAVLRRAG